MQTSTAGSHSHKSVYVRGNSSNRGRGLFLSITVAILLIAVGLWTVAYTRSVELTPPGGTQVVDPGVASTQRAIATQPEEAQLKKPAPEHRAADTAASKR